MDLMTGWTGAVIGFVVALVPLVILHEFGHLLMAKYFGVWAREFGIGYPPRIMKLFHWGETVFTLNWIPFGGFVRLEGELEQEEPSASQQEMTPEELAEAKKHSLKAQPPGARVWIFLAGPLMNLLTAWVLAVIMFMSGVPTYKASVGAVAPDSPAQAAGIQTGDMILAINGKKTETAEDVVQVTRRNLGQPCKIALLRGGETLTVTLVPRVHPPEGQGSIGIMLGGTMTETTLKRYTFQQAVIEGTRYCWTFTKLTLSLPVQMARGLLPASEARPVGVVGISRLAQSALNSSVVTNALYPVLSLIILVSISLGVFNLLPIPPLDGGHILFVIVERIRRKPLTPELEARIYTIAMGLMIVLFVFITVLDIINPIPIP